MGSPEPHRNSTYMRSTFSVWSPSILLIPFTRKRPHGDKDWLHFLDPGEIPWKPDKLELWYKNLSCVFVYSSLITWLILDAPINSCSWSSIYRSFIQYVLTTPLHTNCHRHWWNQEEGHGPALRVPRAWAAAKDDTCGAEPEGTMSLLCCYRIGTDLAFITYLRAQKIN